MKSILRLTRYLKPYRFAAIAAPLLMLVEVAGDLAQPQFIKRIIDVGIAQGDMTCIVTTSVQMVLVTLAGALGGIGCTYFAAHAALKMGTDVRSALFRKVMSLSFGNFDRLKTGGLITRLTNDVVQIQDMVAMVLRNMIRSPFMLIGSIVMAIVTSLQLSVVPAIVLPILGVVIYTVIRKAYPIFRDLQNGVDEVNTVIQENLAGVRVVKAFVRSDYEEERFDEVNSHLMGRSMAAMRVMAAMMPLAMLIVNLGVVAIILYGGLNVANGMVSVGGLVAFINYLIRSRMAVGILAMLLTRLSRSMASADRVEEVLNEVPEIHPPENPLRPERIRGEIRFENVTFSYAGSDADAILKDVSFRIAPGETVAILGSTGSGKTSLINLIPRFYDVDSGRITLDGIDVRDLDEQVLRSRVVTALQDSVLFSGSIIDNLRYGRPDASRMEIEECAVDAQAADFILETPDGYESIVGQRGVNLSGGQKQRVAIARALLPKPDILILDDCTSAVDVRTEGEIQDSLERRRRNQTTIIVAQRISTVLTADRILVLEDGKLSAEGSHEELMAGSALYRDIFTSQLGEQGAVDG